MIMFHPRCGDSALETASMRCSGARFSRGSGACAARSGKFLCWTLRDTFLFFFVPSCLSLAAERISADERDPGPSS